MAVSRSISESVGKVNYLGKSTRLCRNMKISSYEIHISTEKRVKRAAEERQMSRSFPSVQKVRKKEKVWQSGKRQQSRSHRGRFPPQPAMTTLKRLRSETRSRNNNCGFIRRLLFVSAWHWFGRQNRDPTGCYITVQSIGKAKNKYKIKEMFHGLSLGSSPHIWHLKFAT